LLRDKIYEFPKLKLMDCEGCPAARPETAWPCVPHSGQIPSAGSVSDEMLVAVGRNASHALLQLSLELLTNPQQHHRLPHTTAHTSTVTHRLSTALFIAPIILALLPFGQPQPSACISSRFSVSASWRPPTAPPTQHRESNELGASTKSWLQKASTSGVER